MHNLTDIKIVLSILKFYGLYAQKKFSQNFLINKSVLDKIIETSALTKDDNVIEIGCGLGVLTQELAQYANKVTVLEMDKNMIMVAKENTKEFKNIEFKETDALRENIPETEYKLIANIPYAITSPILKKFLIDVKKRPSKIVFLIQKEVAEKICAKKPHMNLLSIMVQIFGEPKLIQTVPKTSFHPAPEVDSAILEINIFDKPVMENYVDFFKIVRPVFSQKRKLLASTLSNTIKKDKKDIEQILIDLDLNPLSRPENLSINNWISLFAKI